MLVSLWQKVEEDVPQETAHSEGQQVPGHQDDQDEHRLELPEVVITSYSSC